ncbi:MAG: hypothetical protein ABIT05_10980 [Chitinophagaceae bacterium]
MNRFRKILCFFLTLCTCYSAGAQTDTVLYQRDSVVDRAYDCTANFFNRSEKIENPAKLILVTKTQKIMKLSAFLASIQPKGTAPVNAPSSAALSPFQEYGLIDLDGDAKKELVLTNHTGGAHCCDEFYFFKNIGPNKYQYAAKTFAGDVCVSTNNVFAYNFYQQLGYFFTCFACAYVDTSDGGPVEIRGILLRYQKGKLAIVPGDQELRSIITDNLGKLGEQPYVKLEGAGAQDDGLRKEFIMNIAVFYYSFGKNIAETKKLFTKYYKFPDAAKVWAEFLKQLLVIRMGNDF